MEVKEKPDAKHITIIKYLNYQKFNINNDLLQTIYQISQDTTSNNYQNFQISKKQYTYIKALLSIMDDIPLLHNEEKENLYYIFILLNLPKYIIKNICRFYQAHMYRQYQISTAHNYFEVMKNNDPLQLLIENLQDVKLKNNEYILFFIDTLNLFFT